MEPIQTVKHIRYLFNVAIRQDRQKLITAISGHDIRSASGSLQLLPKYPQYVVSDGVAVLIIYLFKVIQVEHNHSQRAAVPLTSRNLFPQTMHDVSTVKHI